MTDDMVQLARRHGGSLWRTKLRKAESAPADTLPAPCRIELRDDGATHRVWVRCTASDGVPAVAQANDSSEGAPG